MGSNERILMMKQLKLFCVSLLLLGGIGFGTGAVIGADEAAGAKPKMATVDMQKLFKEYHRTVAAQKRFNLEYARIQKNINERVEVINRMRRMLQAVAEELKQEGLSEEMKNTKRREGQLVAQELKMSEQDIKTFSRQEKQRVAKLKAASMQGIMLEIKKKVEVHAKEQGFDMVFDKSGKNTNQVSFFLYLKDAKDITANMLKNLNKFAPGADGN